MSCSQSFWIQISTYPRTQATAPTTDRTSVTRAKGSPNKKPNGLHSPIATHLSAMSSFGVCLGEEMIGVNWRRGVSCELWVTTYEGPADSVPQLPDSKSEFRWIDRCDLVELCGGSASIVGVSSGYQWIIISFLCFVFHMTVTMLFDIYIYIFWLYKKFVDYIYRRAGPDCT